jgi:hypothetical protein
VANACLLHRKQVGAPPPLTPCTPLSTMAKQWQQWHCCHCLGHTSSMATLDSYIQDEAGIFLRLTNKGDKVAIDLSWGELGTSTKAPLQWKCWDIGCWYADHFFSRVTRHKAGTKLSRDDVNWCKLMESSAPKAWLLIHYKRHLTLLQQSEAWDHSFTSGSSCISETHGIAIIP